jgi:hypothetical protein
MRSTCLYAGVALAALAGLSPGAAAQPPGPGSAAARPASSCPVPQGWSAARPDRAEPPQPIPPIVNQIAVLPREGQRWNYSPVDREMFGRFLQISGLMTPPPVLLFWPDDGAGCDDLAATAAFVASRFPCTPQTCRLAAAAPPRRDPPPAPPPPPPPPPGWKR